MNYADYALGTWYPMGGMSEVVKAMVTLPKNWGVQGQPEREVVKVEAENARVKRCIPSGLSIPQLM
jgi:phytoene desaturase